jgi:hypothetical protein
MIDPALIRIRRAAALAGALAFLLALGACDSIPVVGEYPDRQTKGQGAPEYHKEAGGQFDNRKTVFGEGGLFGDNKKSTAGEASGAGIGVNSFLWRASLDTVSFMPVTSADPFGGVIITDWHAPGGVAEERFKLNIYILGRSLRADGVRVSVFRQVRDAALGWRDAGVTDGTATQIEDAILTRARQLRNESLLR